jgi:hypothetical protein
MEQFVVNQKLILDYSINLTQYAVLWATHRYFSEIPPTSTIDGAKYYSINYTKVVEFCAAAQISPSSAPKIVEFLVSRNLLAKKKYGRKFVFGELCKFAKFERNPLNYLVSSDCSIILEPTLVTSELSNTIITSNNSITINNAPARIYSETNQSSEVFNNTKGKKCKFAKSAKNANLQNSGKFPSKVLFTLWDEVNKQKCAEHGMNYIRIEWGKTTMDRNALKNVYNIHLDTLYRNMPKIGFSPIENAENGVLFYNDFKLLFERFFEYGLSKRYMVGGEFKYPVSFTPVKLHYNYSALLVSPIFAQAQSVNIDLSEL